ncbi:MAG: hypothetical protein F6J89_00455 [Symploca sp. SIO1C4]|uniref:Uncharacterized protein n=1 Tax=Symploca sp. SIO1C4 TaxID=2607765 RepID=A0A6B3NAF1_9CYAN|nr:hypothetical protein [Symploca sp. SIO1C4]
MQYLFLFLPRVLIVSSVRIFIAVLGNLLYIAMVVFISAQIAMFAAQPAQAAPEEHILKNPPLLKLRQEPTSFTDLPSQRRLSGEGVGGEGTQKEFDLEIDYITNKIRNPANGQDAYDTVELRGYVGTGTSDASLCCHNPLNA